MNKIKLTTFIVTLLLALALPAQKTNNTKTETSQQSKIKIIEKDWLNSLLLGNDISHLSQSYAKQLKQLKANKRKSKLIRGNNYFENFKTHYSKYVKDLAKLAKLDKKVAEIKWENKVIYLKQSYERAKQAQNQLLTHLEKQHQFLIENATSKAKLQFTEKLIQQTHGKLSNETHELLGNRSLNKFEHLTHWQEFITKQNTKHKRLAKEAKSHTIIHPIKILRNSSLPYAGRNYSAPPLSYAPEIIPSYADENAQAGQPIDLNEDLVVQFSPAINQLATDLGNDYIKIVNYVRQNIKLEYYTGAQKGADATLRSLAGNDIDQAALLVALLRRSNIPARFVSGVIRQPIDQVMASVGLTNPNQVLAAINKAGIAHKPIVEGGQVRAVHRQYTWVSAYLPYANYRGSAADLGNNTWIPLAPAIKKDSITSNDYNYQDGNIDPDTLVIDYLTTSNNQSPLLFWKNQVQADIDTNYPTLNYEDLLDRQQNETEQYKLLPSSLPFEVIAITQESYQLSDDQIQSLTLQMGENAEFLDVTILLPEIAGKRLTLSYIPATVDDLNIINQSRGMALVEPYLVDLRPVIKINGRQVQAQNSPMPMASFANLKISFNSISGTETFYRNTVIGNYLTLTVTTQSDKFILDNEDPNLFADETRPSRIMHNLAKQYNQQWNQGESEIAAIMDVALIKPIPALTIIAPEYNVIQSQGLTTELRFKGISIDAVTKSVDAIGRGNNQNAYDFYRLSALQGSYLESNIFETQWATPAISADQGIRRLADTSTILQLTPDNYQTQLANTSHSQFIKDEIENWLSNGNHVLLTPNTDTINIWSGSSWHVFDSQTGHSGYFISGIYAGGQTTQDPNNWLNEQLGGQLYDPYSEGSNDNPLAASSIEIIESSNNQIGMVNTVLPEALKVIVRDIFNNPVINASVIYTITQDKATLIDPNISSNTSTSFITVLTNEQGVAEINVKLWSKIGFAKLLLLNPDDQNLSKIGNAIIKPSVLTSTGELKADSVFNVFYTPAMANKIELICWIEGADCISEVSPGGSRSSVMHYRVLDIYDNVVSNVNVEISSQGQSRESNWTNSDKNIKHAELSNFGLNEYSEMLDVNTNNKVKSRQNDNNCDPYTDPGPKLILEEYDEGENAGPYSTYSSARIALKEDCSEQSLTAPGCASESKQTASNYFHSTFYVYSPVNGGVTISLSSPSIATETSSITINSWDEREDYTYLVHGQDHFYGPYGLYHASSPGNSVSIKKALYIGKTIIEGGYYYLDKLPTSLETEYTYYDEECEPETFDDGTVEISASGNGSLDVTIIENDFDQFTYSLPSSPGRAEFTIDVDIAFPSAADDSFDYTLTFGASAYAATVNITGIIPSAFELNNESRLIDPMEISIQISPELYRPEDIEITVYENGNVIDQGQLKYPPGSEITVLFDYKEVINPSSLYEIEVIMNKNSPFEIRSDRTSITNFSQQIVTHVNCSFSSEAFSGQSCGGRVVNAQIPSSLRLLTSIDISDPLVCKEEGINLSLNSDASIIVELEKLDESGQLTGEIIIIAEGTYPAGSSIIPVTADQLGNGTFNVKISATSLLTGNSETITGQLNSVFEIKDSLLIGHPVVKGVDLADGSMIYSKKDISLPAPGADLEFIRTYSNKNRYELGPMGYGWSHNYMSRVIVSDCGRIYVTGADGGTARFRTYNDEIIPMKGFHSTLEANADGSFSFYSKNGTHYHYLKRQNRVWWMDYIEDTNGNRLTIQSERRNGAPIITSVKDSVGRLLIYNYQTRTFNNNTGQILSSITGPEGMKIDFTYNSNGQLLTAKREGDTTDESYEYSTEVAGFNVNLLTKITNNTTSAVREYQYRNKTISLPGSITVPENIKDKEVLSITETNGGTTTFNYVNAVGFNDGATINQNGTITNYILNDYGAATNISAPNGSKAMVWEIADEILLMSETDENGRTKFFEYDDNANLTKETIGSISRNYTYKAADTSPPYIKDQIKTYSNWRGKTTTFDYDTQGNKIQETLGSTSIQYTYDTKGLVKTIKDGRGNTRIFNYDSYGQLTSQTDAAGNNKVMTWDTRGRKTSETDLNGNQTNFNYDSSDRVTNKTISGDESRSWNYTYANGGLTKTETDPNGQQTVYTYDKMGRLLNIKNADDSNFSYTYDNNGNKLSETDFNGNTTTFSYDNVNRLITKTEPETKVTNYTYDNVGNVLTETTSDRESTYSYDPKRYFLTSFTGSGGGKAKTENSKSANTTRTVDGEGNILSETDPNGNTTTLTYDNFNRVLTESAALGSGKLYTYDGNGNIAAEVTTNPGNTQTRTYSYNSANYLTSYIDATGNTTSYQNDGNGNVTTETRPQGKVTSYQYNNLNLVTSKTQTGDPVAAWQYSYDSAGNLVTEILPNGNVINTTYDNLNRPTRKTDSIGTISSFSYDANSNIITETYGNSNLTTYNYNGLNQRLGASKPLFRGHTYTYTLFGEMKSDSGPNGTINYSINSLGQRTSATGPNGYNESYNYDANDNLTSFTDSRGTSTNYSINSLNQTTSQTTDLFSKTFSYDTLGNKLSESDYKGITSSYTYDKENRQTSFTKAGQLQQSTIYNSAGLAQTQRDANGNTRVHQYNAQYYRTQTNLPETQVITYSPNAFGDVESQNNPGPNDITRVFDARRRLISETNGAGEQTKYEYDLNNNRTAVIKPDGTRWNYSYDAANRLTSISNPIGTTTYGYDNKDNLVSIKDAENKTTTFNYDNRNRKLSKNYPDGGNTSYSYDANGNLQTTNLPNGTNIIYGYDALNRKTSENYSSPYGSGSVTYTLDPNGNPTTISETLGGTSFTTTQSFDDLNRITSRTDVYGNSYQYNYDANGNRKIFNLSNNGQTSYAYDGLNRLTTLTHAGLGTFNWSYNSAGLTNNISYPNSASVQYQYDSANRITSIANKKSGADITQHLYQYDQNGNRTQMTESNININQIINYTYDQADRLTSVQYPNATTIYTLDKVGNRTRETITGTNPNTKTYSYNNRDQLTAISDSLGSNTVYIYDSAGNQLSKDTDGLTTTFDYTARHRVKSITIGASNPINYQYDYTGQRVNYQSNGIEKRYLYDGLALIAETNTIGNTLAKYIYGNRYQLAEQRNSLNSYYHVDSLGTNVAVTNQDGSIQARYEYDAFGNLLTQAGSSETPFGFTGYQKDEDTGLYYANARYYDSETARFNREDPFDGDVNTPPSLHRYLY
ncbi:Beta-galactosidase, partial [hydrothermal vent metagenome]